MTKAYAVLKRLAVSAIMLVPMAAGYLKAQSVAGTDLTLTNNQGPSIMFNAGSEHARIDYNPGNSGNPGIARWLVNRSGPMVIQLASGAVYDPTKWFVFNVQNGNAVFGSNAMQGTAKLELENAIGNEDYISAGNGVFRVANDGRVFVQGQQLGGGAPGPAGQRGPQGIQGIQGPPGPPVQTFAMCSTNQKQASCGCNYVLATQIVTNGSSCQATAGTGSCTGSSTGGLNGVTSGSCCVCSPTPPSSNGTGLGSR